MVSSISILIGIDKNFEDHSMYISDILHIHLLSQESVSMGHAPILG